MKTASDLTCLEVPHGSDEYEKCVQLRYQVLREPLGLTFSPQQLTTESGDFHLAAFREHELVACLVLTPKENHSIIMRQVAVAASSQRQGIGQILVAFAEKIALEKGFTSIVLHARETAIPFYEKLGYKCVGEPFEEVTLPHREMVKELLS